MPAATRVISQEGPANLRELVAKATDGPEYPLGTPSSARRILGMMPEVIALYEAAQAALGEAQEGLNDPYPRGQLLALRGVRNALGPSLRALDEKCWVGEPEKQVEAGPPAV